MNSDIYLIILNIFTGVIIVQRERLHPLLKRIETLLNSINKEK